MLKRANSISEIVDEVIEKADVAIDKYFPDKVNLEHCDEVDAVDTCKSKNHAVRTLLRSQRLSKKIKSKISVRTAAEVKALKSDVSILIYGTEYILTNPIGAIRKLNDFWHYLSENEPENQKRPETLEELVVVVMRGERPLKAVIKIVIHVNHFRNCTENCPHDQLYMQACV